MPERKFRDAEDKNPTITPRRSPRLLQQCQEFAEMPERKFGDAGDQKPTITPRRSPRFLQQCQNSVEIAETSKTANSRLPLKDKGKRDVGLRSGNRKSPECENLEKCGKITRISCRSQNGTQLRGEEALVSHYLIEKRVTRSSVRGQNRAGGKVSECVFDEGSLSKEGNEFNLCGQRGGNVEKRVTRNERRGVALYKGSDVVNASSCEVDMSEERKLKGGQDLGMKGAAKSEKRVTRRHSNLVGSNTMLNVVVSDKKNPNRDAIRGKPTAFDKRVIRSWSKKSETNEPDLSFKKVGNVEKGITRCSTRKDAVDKASSLLVQDSCKISRPENRKLEDGSNRIHREINFAERTEIGEKRKRYGVDEEKEIGCGWTAEQELALRRAYFTAKPTPHFWKKVAKMVPGKSAEECFDKIQSDHQTPPQPRTRLRPTKRKKLSPIPCSASKLLTPVDAKSKKLKPRKMNVLLAQKTVRKLLQKHQEEDRDHRGLDLFALLEPSANEGPSSPNIQECDSFDSPSSSKQEEASDSSASKKHKSRLSFLSPPVLKQIKNRALHEKYIDQLHRRDAKRKAESRRNAKRDPWENDEKQSHLRENAVKVAKDALVFDALDAVSKLRSLKSDDNDSPNDDYDTTDHSDEQE